jgi:hypothetical protein
MGRQGRLCRYGVIALQEINPDQNNNAKKQQAMNWIADDFFPAQIQERYCVISQA